MYHNATNGTTSPARISPSALLVNMGLGWVISLLSSNLVLLGGGLQEYIITQRMARHLPRASLPRRFLLIGVLDGLSVSSPVM